MDIYRTVGAVLLAAFTLISPITVSALDESFGVGDADPLVELFMAGVSCGSKVSAKALENIKPFGACPMRLDGSDSDSCARAKKSCLDQLVARCNADCEPPVVGTNICTLIRRSKTSLCQADCSGVCGRKKTT